MTTPSKGQDLGTKRQCPKCSARFYDFNADPVICVKCNARVPTAPLKAKRKQKAETPVPAAKIVKKPLPQNFTTPDESEVTDVEGVPQTLELEQLEDEEVEVMSLEEVGEHEEEEEADPKGDDAEDEMFIEEEMAASGIVDDIRAYIETDEEIDDEENPDVTGEDEDDDDEDSPSISKRGKKRG
ncbi:MAG: FYDLN acid domain-containing protein [Alphaproteobacteria bacterium]|nr:FYDLN acid domain-containing protein [Rickettsiales bacterium]